MSLAATAQHAVSNLGTQRFVYLQSYVGYHCVSDTSSVYSGAVTSLRTTLLTHSRAPHARGSSWRDQVMYDVRGLEVMSMEEVKTSFEVLVLDGK